MNRVQRITQNKKPCHYTDPAGNRCVGKAKANGLCYWHNPDIPKTGNDVKQRLEKYAQSGHSMAGFSLRYANLEGIHLTKPDENAGLNLTYADFYHANLKNAHLFHVDLHGSSLMKADLNGANLNCANLRKTNLLGINLKNAKIENIRWGNRIVQEENARIALEQGDFSRVT